MDFSGFELFGGDHFDDHHVRQIDDMINKHGSCEIVLSYFEGGWIPHYIIGDRKLWIPVILDSDAVFAAFFYNEHSGEVGGRIGKNLSHVLGDFEDKDMVFFRVECNEVLIA